MVFTFACAQLLSASKDLSPGGMSSSKTERVSAQRLSASKDLSPVELLLQSTHPLTCSTPFGIKGFVTIQPSNRTACPTSVLNAFRHQRICHNSCWRACRVFQLVLNAFRHQRICHCKPNLIPYSSPRCSTPFGIKGFVTMIHWHPCASLWKCSTPFGIKGFVTGG